MFVCNICGRSFIDGLALFMHTNSKHSALYECTHCDRTFNTEAGRDQHEEAKHSEYECTYCDRMFRTEEGRDQHEEAKHPEYECTYCDRTFRTEAGRDQHEEAKHPEYECTYCDRTFTTLEGRDQHEEAKHPPEYDCVHCDRTFTTSEGRDQHENAKHAASRFTFYSSSYQLRDPVTSWKSTPALSGDHSDVHLAEDSDVSDDNSDVLSDDHRKSQQTLLAVEHEVGGELSSSGLTPSPPTSPPGYGDELVEVVVALQSCSVRPEYGSISCDMDMLEHVRFMIPTLVRTALILSPLAAQHVTGAVEQQPHIAGSQSLGLEHTITSQTHDTSSAQQASYSMQAELYHTNLKHSAEYECTHCDRIFTTEAGRDQHEESKHPEYECSHCDHTFKTEAGRDQHEETKHPEYGCTHCDRTFKTEATRDQHAEAKHPPEYGIHCDRTFMTSEGRDWHQRTKHRFRCIPCDRVFISEVALEQHDEAVHPVYECRYCDREFLSEQSCMQHENANHAASWSAIHSSSYQLRDPVTSREFTPAPSGDHSEVSITLPKEQVTVPKPVAKFPCETCMNNFATMPSVDFPGAIEPKVVEDSLIESRESIDPLVDGRRNIAEDTMTSQHEQTLLDVEREVDGELSSSGPTPSPPASLPQYKDEMMEVDITLQSCAVRLECGSIPCDMDMLEHHVTGTVEQQPCLILHQCTAIPRAGTYHHFSNS
ncbi:hypothetical protein AZE42_07955 [Rhizopogon vesiculosus]|uniref:C2H2-type domain-containing protein n=1 Tax=Rhizopogon vesiculosus TaxID=180088 RepID=A0A1J8QT74_9AGAM|nr:hypothetical protein AZE42_07955 [Rhizopogon vesiculosus]